MASDSLQKANHGTTLIHHQQHNRHPLIHNHDSTPICHIKPLDPQRLDSRGEREREREIKERKRGKRSAHATTTICPRCHNHLRMLPQPRHCTTWPTLYDLRYTNAWALIHTERDKREGGREGGIE